MENMETKIVLNVYEADSGDFFWLKYKADNSWRHVLIDSGGAGAFRDYRRVLKYIKKESEMIEAIIFTHIDNDHIGGGMKALSGMREEELPVIHQVIMNSVADVSMRAPQSVQLTVGQAVKLESVFADIGLAGNMVSPVLQGDVIQLPGGAEIRVISPDRESLRQFDAMVDKKLEREEESPQLGAGKEQPYMHHISDYVREKDTDDKRLENMAGIAFVFALRGIRLAFLADANAHVCAEGLGLFYEKGSFFDLVKLSHHGSLKNTTRELTEAMEARNFLLSTNGHGEKPSKQALCRLLEAYERVDLLCNYAWWERHYMDLYFTERDNEEYIRKGRLQVIPLGEEERALCGGLTIRLRRKNREIEG